MKLPVVLTALVTLCAGSTIPQVPGDNSHYVEGQSRYIWMPDGDGTPHLVDLQEPVDERVLRNRNGADNQYWLYTRQNPNVSQIIVHGDANTIVNSSYNANRELKVIVHGWSNTGDSTVNTMVRDAFLSVLDCNVIVVDWSDVASLNYISASLGVPSVGQYIGNFLVWLIETAGGDWNNVHLVGHSLGAHVVGNAGRAANGLPIRVSGLDPAGPLWGDNDDALSVDAGIYVECIHTDGGVLGINEPICDVNFYPNGGRNAQPGCWISTCSHSRSYQLFAATVQYNHLMGSQCDDLDQANDEGCTGDTQLEMGNSVLNKTGSGLFGLTTGEDWPY